MSNKYYLFLLLHAVSFACSNSKEISYWDLIDDKVIAVYEPSNNFENQISNKKDSLLVMALVNTPIAVDVYPSGKDEIELIYFCKANKRQANELVTLFSNKIKFKDIKLISRKFNGYEIQELLDVKGNLKLAFTQIQNFVLVSKSSLLIENVIRTSDGREKTFKSSNPKPFQHTTLKADQGNLYINYKELLKTFGSDSLFAKTSVLKGLAQSSILDIKSVDGSLVLSGFSVDSLDNEGLSLLREQKPVAIQMIQVVPNCTRLFIHYGITDYSKIPGTTKSGSIEFSGNEIGFIQLSKNLNEYVLILKIEKGKIPDAFQNESKDSIYHETYSNYKIKSTPITFSLNAVVQKLLPKSELSYYFAKDNYLFFAPAVPALKTTIDALENEDTWGKSIEFQSFHSKNLQESNLTIIQHNSQGRDLDQNSIIDQLLAVLGSNNSALKWSSIQYSSLDEDYYTSVNLSFGKNIQKESKKKAYSGIEIPGAIASFHLVKNHSNGSDEVLIQDQSNKIYLVNGKGELLWTRTVDEPIQTNVLQLDYLKNRKLQYFFTTLHKIYIMDRLGRDIANFPKQVSYTVKFSDLVDYDRSKNYRLLVAEPDQIHLMSKEGVELPFWNPKILDGSLLAEPRHYRIGGVDYFLVVLENELHLYNRRGEELKNFPVKINAKLTSNYFFKQGTNLATSTLTLLSTDGEVIKVDLRGNIQRQNLVRGKNSSFSIEMDGDSYSFVRIDKDKIAVFSEDGQLLFEIPNPGSDSLQPQSFTLHNQHRIFSFFDSVQNMAYVYDEKGSALGINPVETSLPLKTLIKPKEQSDFIYAVLNNSIRVIEIK